MIILHEESLKTLAEYGIDIPVRRSRAQRVLASLLAEPHAGQTQQLWLSRGPMPSIGPDDLTRVHRPSYVDLLLSDRPDKAVIEAYELDDQRVPGRFDRSTASRPLGELVDKALSTCAGTLMACSTALERGFAYFLGGGMHHAMSDRGRGFCLVNDIVIAIRRLRAEGRINTAWVVDTDAHKGDGTAELCLSDPQTLTLSIHMARGWPLDGPVLGPDDRLDRSWYPSTVDIPIPSGSEEYYVPALDRGLGLLAALACGVEPDLVVVVAGADPFERDALPSTSPVRLTLEQLDQRDAMVYDFFMSRNIPQAWLMAGGYGDEAWQVPCRFLKRVIAERIVGPDNP